VPANAKRRTRVLGLFLCAVLVLAMLLFGSASGGDMTINNSGKSLQLHVFQAAQSGDQTETYAFDEDPEDLRRTWNRAIVFVPGPEIGAFIYGRLGTASVRQRLAALSRDRRYPLVIYLHDSLGESLVDDPLVEEFEVENFAAIFPYSRVRGQWQTHCRGKPEPCNVPPQVYRDRAAEMTYTVRRARQLPWVDRDNIFLVGLGDGAAVIAASGAEVEVNGYVIAGWTCTAPPELPGFDGLWTPIDRPVLLLNGRTNRWRRQADWDGSCEAKAGDHRDVTSLEIDTHIENLFTHPAGRTALIAFLHAKFLR
jgi:hypothetical protein